MLNFKNGIVQLITNHSASSAKKVKHQVVKALLTDWHNATSSEKTRHLCMGANHVDVKTLAFVREQTVRIFIMGDKMLD